MIKRNLKTLILTSIIILLPIVAGVLLWDQLPEQMPIHWNIHNEVDQWVAKPIAVFGMPLFLVAVQWIGLLATGADPKKKNISEVMIQLMLWLCPVLSLVVNGMIMATALGTEVTPTLVMPLLLSILFLIIGNFLPKCRQSYTVGIKLAWTLASEANWNATHRFAGWVWTIGGILMLVSIFIGGDVLMLGTVLVMVIAPIFYSYNYYSKHESSEE